MKHINYGEEIFVNSDQNENIMNERLKSLLLDPVL